MEASRQSGFYRSRVSEASEGQGISRSGYQIEPRQYGEIKGTQEGTSSKKP